jgi:hypothetical protein
MSDMIVWKKYQPRAAFLCLQSCYLHLWYQMVVLSLLDRDLAKSDKEEMAMKLFSLEREEKIQTGKPTFPSISRTVKVQGLWHKLVCAERGIQLVSEFIERCRDEDQRQALLQVVEEHRNKFQSYNKATLAKL